MIRDKPHTYGAAGPVRLLIKKIGQEAHHNHVSLHVPAFLPPSTLPMDQVEEIEYDGMLFRAYRVLRMSLYTHVCLYIACVACSTA